MNNLGISIIIKQDQENKHNMQSNVNSYRKLCKRINCNIKNKLHILKGN